MKLLINFPDNLHAALKNRAEAKGQNVSVYIRTLIEKDTKTKGDPLLSGFQNPKILEKALKTRKKQAKKIR